MQPSPTPPPSYSILDLFPTMSDATDQSYILFFQGSPPIQCTQLVAVHAASRYVPCTNSLLYSHN